MKLQKRKQRGLFMATLFFVILALQFSYLLSVRNYLYTRKEDTAKSYGQLVATTFRLSLKRYDYLAEAAAQALILDEDHFLDDFEYFCDRMLKQHSAIQFAYVAKEAIIVECYPYAEARMNLGNNAYQDFAWSEKTYATRAEKRNTIIGPTTLTMGGDGILLLYPIDKTLENQLHSDWGVALVLDNNDLKKEIEQELELEELDQYCIAFYHELQNEESGKYEKNYFLSFGSIVSSRVDVPFEIDGQTFHIVVDRKDGWDIKDEYRPYVVFVLILGAFLWLLAYMLIRIEYNARRLEFVTQADEAKARFLAQMSHDLRTPLTGILGMISISDRHATDYELLRENRIKGRKAVQHMLSLINNLLEYTKYETGQDKLEHIPFDIRKLAKECCEIVDSQTDINGISVKCDLSGVEDDHLIGSPRHVKEVFLNLYSNAMKYNKENGTIFIKLREFSKEENRMVYELVIRDTGIGMTQEYLDKKLFVKYEREVPYYRAPYSGTGLGLPIVKKIVDSMGGSIQIASELGEGSVCRVLFPFEINHNEPKPEEDDIKELKQDLINLRILLVDDTDMTLEVEKLLLEDLGAIVTTARCGEEVLQIFADSKEGTFDAILLDISMPDMTGYEVSKELREKSRKDAKHIPIIALAAFVFKEEIERCRLFGMNDYVAKPFDSEEIIRVIHQYMQKDRKRKG